MDKWDILWKRIVAIKLVKDDFKCIIDDCKCRNLMRKIQNNSKIIN